MRFPSVPIFENQSTVGTMSDEREDVYSKVVRAGRRTYFFDVKSTRDNDLFLTITERKKHTREDGTVSYEKHKLFLYKEDFANFTDGLHDALDRIVRSKDEIPLRPGPGPQDPNSGPDAPPTTFTDLDFEDLGKT